MKCKTIIIDKEREEEVLIYVHAKNKFTEQIESFVLTVSNELVGYKDKTIVNLSQNDIYCFAIENNKVVAILEKVKYEMKERLYELENLFGNSFVKINQSCVVNISKIERFDASFSGTLLVALKNGYKDYVSRRQLKTVKERLGLKK